MRAAVYHEISPVSRREHHARAATIVDDEAASLRHRVAGAFVEDPVLAGDLAAFARREADRGAWGSAADALVSASRLVAGVPATRDLLLEGVECMLLGGDLSAALAATEDVSAFEQSAHRDYVLGTLALMVGRHEEAEQLLVRAFEACDQTTERRLVADIAGQLSNLHLTWARPGEGATWAARALDAGQGRSLVDVLSCQATGLVMSGRRAEALSCVAGLPDPSRHRTLDSLNGYLGRGFARCVTDDFAGARSDLLPLIGALGQRGLTYVAIAAISVLAVAEYRLGLWDDAVMH
ncbi:MAG: helix-turn-helix transcriptional regulator, partial [Candidatus Dormibacteria bacterium]